MQSRYYDPETGRFINADDIAFLGADGTPISYNLFAYCKNSPTCMVDVGGNLGIFALIAIGGLLGGLIDYAGQVISNYRNGMSGSEAFTSVNIGSIAASAFSGALSAIPGGGLLTRAADIVGSAVIEHGVNAMISNESMDLNALGADIATNAILDVATPKFLPVDDVPKYIRDIKGEAVEAGIKGTKNLNKYLNVKQVHTITTNTFYNDIASRFGSRIFR